MITLPSKYDNLGLHTKEKILLNALKSKLDNNNYFLIKISPLQKIVLNCLIMPEGVVFIENFEINDLELI